MFSEPVASSCTDNSTAIFCGQQINSSALCDVRSAAIKSRAMKKTSSRRELTAEEKAEAARLKQAYLRHKDIEKAAGRKLTQAMVAELCGWDGQAVVSHYLNGAMALNVDALLRLSKALRIDPESVSPRLTSYLDRKEVQPNFDSGNVEPVDTVSTYRYPVVSWVAAGSFAEATEAYAMADCERLSTDYRAIGQAFWLRVRGDSMTSPVGTSITEGTLILVDPGVEPATGDLVIAKLPDSNEATFKKLVEDAGQMYLKALNPSYPILPFKSGCTIVGVVTETKQKLR